MRDTAGGSAHDTWLLRALRCGVLAAAAPSSDEVSSSDGSGNTSALEATLARGALHRGSAAGSWRGESRGGGASSEGRRGGGGRSGGDCANAGALPAARPGSGPCAGAEARAAGRGAGGALCGFGRSAAAGGGAARGAKAESEAGASDADAATSAAAPSASASSAHVSSSSARAGRAPRAGAVAGAAGTSERLGSSAAPFAPQARAGGGAAPGARAANAAECCANTAASCRPRASSLSSSASSAAQRPDASALICRTAPPMPPAGRTDAGVPAGVAAGVGKRRCASSRGAAEGARPASHSAPWGASAPPRAGGSAHAPASRDAIGRARRVAHSARRGSPDDARARAGTSATALRRCWAGWLAHVVIAALSCVTRPLQGGPCGAFLRPLPMLRRVVLRTSRRATDQRGARNAARFTLAKPRCSITPRQQSRQWSVSQVLTSVPDAGVRNAHL